MMRTPRLPRWLVLAVITLISVVRLVISALTPGMTFDVDTFSRWGQVLVDHPLRDFYAFAGPVADHLPGDLYVHALLARFTTLVGAGPGSPSYVLCLKVTASIADLACALVVYRISRQIAGPNARVASQVGLLAVFGAPGSILVAANWGQWDSVSVLFFLVGLEALLARRSWLACLMFAWATLTKPQLGLAAVAAVAVIEFGARHGWRTLLARFSAWGAGACVVVTVLSLPFGIGPAWLGGHWSLLERLSQSEQQYPVVSLGSTGVWTLFYPGWHSDSATIAGVTLRTFGHLLLGAALCAIAVQVMRNVSTRHKLPALAIWAAGTSMYAFCITETRVHERYMLPATVVLVLWATASELAAFPVAVAAATLTIFGATIATALELLVPSDSAQLPYSLLAGLNVVLFLLALVVGPSGRLRVISRPR